jgi:O-antigen ligase
VLLDSRIPQLLFFLILATIPFFKFRQLGDLFFLKLDWLLTAALLALIISILLITKSIPGRLKANIWPPLLFFFFLNSIASILSPFPDIATGGMVVLLQVIAFAAISLLLLNTRNIVSILPWVLSLSIGANVVLALLGANFGFELFVEEGRALGGTITANNMALMSVFVFPISLHLVLFSEGTMSRFLALILALLAVVGLIISGSRGGFVNFLIVLAFLAWHFRTKINIRYLGLAFSGIAIVLVVFLVTVPQDYWERQATLRVLTDAVGEDTRVTGDRSLERRTAYLIVAKDSVLDRPFLGYGTNTFGELWYLSQESDAFDDVRRPAHNTYAEVVVGTGVLGLASFIVLLAVVYRNYMRAERLLDSVSDRSASHLVAMYRIAYTSVLFYFLVKSGLDHKLFILAVALSTTVVHFAEQELARSAENHDPLLT